MKRSILMLLTIYVLVKGKSGDYVVSYEGQSKQTVTKLLSELGRKGKFISEQEYNAYLTGHFQKEKPGLIKTN